MYWQQGQWLANRAYLSLEGQCGINIGVLISTVNDIEGDTGS